MVDELSPAPERPQRSSAASSDFALAHRFLLEHGEDARFYRAWGKWLVWEGGRWLVDEGTAVEKLAAETVRAIELEGAPRRATAAAIAGLLRVASASSSARMRPERLDLIGSWFNCANGTLDLTTGELRPHQRDDFITRISPIAYEFGATTPRWSAFVSMLAGGDPLLAEKLERFAGYLLSGDRHDATVFFLTGPPSGTTLFLRMLLEVLGDYAIAGAGEETEGDAARLHGVRLVVGTDVDGRPISVGALAHPTRKLVLAGRRAPELVGSPASRRRFQTISLAGSALEEGRVRQLLDELRAEREGILRWAVRGYAMYQEEGLEDLVPPTRALAAIDERFEAVLRERFEFGARYEVAERDILRAYVEACGKAFSPAKWLSLGPQLRRHGARPKKGPRKTSTRIWRGLRLKSVPAPASPDVSD